MTARFGRSFYQGNPWLNIFGLRTRPAIRTANCKAYQKCGGEERLFGDEQLAALKDYIQAALKLNYNKRVVG